MTSQSLTITIENQSYPILTLKGRPKALLDCTVAEIYGVETKHINQAVKNNLDKFPSDFYYQLTENEYIEIIESVVAVKNFDRYESLKKSNFLPYAFTHLGCNMLATILKSEQATRRAVDIIRAFTALECSEITIPKDPLEIISLQGRMISTLAEEIYKNRNQIDNHDKQIVSSDRKIHTLEDKMDFVYLRLSHLETP